jgi:SAM-dependent MidA family methyltransferase
LRFSDYFESWLYGYGGYYSSLRPIGKDGDFFTSVSTSQFFGGSIANYIIKQIDNGNIKNSALVLEIGAHKGFLLKDIVTFIYTLRPELLKTLRFGVVERFDAVAIELSKFANEHFGGEVSFQIFSSLEEINEESGFVYANEIFDAFSCELLHDGKFASIQSGKIAFDINDDRLLEHCCSLGIIKGEISIGFDSFASSLAKAFEYLEFLSFDYGQEYPRNDFSIRIYKEHCTFPLFEIEDLNSYFKCSDITLDVNFDQLTKEFLALGFERKFYKTQMSALVDFGLLDLLEILRQKAGEAAYQAELSKVKLLISPSHFGERFKAISFTKG